MLVVEPPPGVPFLQNTVESPDEKTEKKSRNENSFELFGDILLRRGQVRRYQLEFALNLQKAYRTIHRDFKVGDILVQHRAISEKTKDDIVTLQLELPRESSTTIMRGVDLDDTTFVTKILSEEMAEA